ncbi:MAG: sensor domain-containing phosphodiesterase [Actinomycetota bacterium]|nr:sensor domain-containing phosphodiesterase [Actinomycetota bacterium]
MPPSAFERAGARARGVESLEEPDRGTSASVGTRTLVPFGICLLAIVVVVGLGATLLARESVDRELEARASTAARLLDTSIARSRARLAADAEDLARGSRGRAETGTNAREALELEVVDFAIEHRLAHASVAERGLAVVDGRPHWRALPLAAAEVKGQPERRVLLGRAMDRRFLAEAEAPLGVLMQIEAGGPAERPRWGERLRTVSLPLRLTDPRTARLDVTLSSQPLHQAVRGAGLVAAGCGLLVVVVLLGFLGALLRRSVLRPLGALRGAIERTEAGDYDVHLPLVGAAEVRTVSDAFNRMCRMVDQQRSGLEVLATTDSLTGLANHRTFHDALTSASASAARGEASFALICLDLDRFKQLNDSCGHPRGDEVLRAVASRLRQVPRGSDLAGRIGGEEFGILLAGADAQAGFEVAERVREAIRTIEVDGFRVDSSAGVAASPDDATDAGRLMDLADAALYQAKLAGRGRTCRFDPRISGPGAVEERRALVGELLSHPESVLSLFQPIVELERGSVVGYEALTRFASDRGTAPSDWFDLARNCGLGPELQALAVARALAVSDRPTGAWVSVNVDPAVPEPVRAALPHDLRDIVIELTEQALPPEDRDLQRELEDLRARGARIALDDAGAGYAGLSHVVRVRPDLIKLDRSLVVDVEHDHVRLALIEAFVSFARRIGAQVCAEGIESSEQLAALVEARVMLGQGYRLGPPAPAWPRVSAEIAERLAG